MAHESEYKRVTSSGASETPDVHDIGNPDVAHEKNDVNVFAIAKFVGGLAIATFAVFGLMWGVLVALEQIELSKETPLSPLARRGAERLPPNPRLQAAPGHEFTPGDVTHDPAIQRTLTNEQLDFKLERPTMEWDVLREAKLRELRTYGRDERRPGEYRIPVDRAKELLLQRNLLASRQTQPSNNPQAVNAQAGGQNAAEQIPRLEGYDTLPTYQSSGQQAERRRQ